MYTYMCTYMYIHTQNLPRPQDTPKVHIQNKRDSMSLKQMRTQSWVFMKGGRSGRSRGKV